ncbi:MAG: SPOR domain-containing protein [Verrucomicrobiae bacterium]|nr:SPOR domain-containing protein [Verrucomicrobiae bacterium]
MRILVLLSSLVLGWSGHVFGQQSVSGPLCVYADLYHGKATASGVPYDKAAYSAAHATLPFGTWLRVANFESGRMVDVLVNDRKKADDRIVTLSKAAAEAIGVPSNRTVPGSLHVLSVPAQLTAAPAAAPAENRKFNPLADLFGKNQNPAPVQYAIPGGQYAPPATPTVPASSYPQPGYPLAAASQPTPELLAMHARTPTTSAPITAPQVPTMPAAPLPVAAAPAVVLPPASASAPYRVQFGAFRRLSSADELSGMLDGAGIPTSVFAGPTGLNVVVTDGGFRSAVEAQRWIDFEGTRRGWTERPVVIR